MRSWRSIILAAAYVATTISGLSKQLEAPGLVAVFERGGIPPEILSLFGAVEFVLALALLFPRSRPAAGVLLAALYCYTSVILWPTGLSVVLAFSIVMVPISLFAGLWNGGALLREPGYQGASPLGLGKERR